MKIHPPQYSYLGPEDLSELSGLFDIAWQELVRDVPVLPDKAEQVRQELAQSILSMRDLEPEVIRRTVIETMRRSKSNGKAQKC
jgi:hypothetical protein